MADSANEGLVERSLWSRLLAPLRGGRDRDAPPDEGAPSLRFVFEIARPLFGRRARSLALGCLMALGGCGDRVEVEGVVRDGRTGRPIAGARVSTTDGRSTETDADGRFAVELADRSPRADRGDAGPESSELRDVWRASSPRVTLNLFDALALDADRAGVGSDAGVRIDLRARGELAGPLRWSQEELGEAGVRLEDDGYALVIQAHPGAQGARAEGAPRARQDAPGACTTCHGSGVAAADGAGADLAVGACAGCHGGAPARGDGASIVDEWTLATMSTFVRDLRDDDPALRAECASCHSAQGFVEWRRRGRHVAPDRGTAAPIACGACHDTHDASRPFAVRVYDTSDPVAGAPGQHMGTGALCASCHRGGVAFSDARDVAPHAPHADVLLGRGARLAPPTDEGAHRWIADTCVRCHMVQPGRHDPLRGLAGGHTFSMRARTGAPSLNRAACAGCHGEADPASIGVRDRDGDGVSGPIGDEHRRALARLDARLRAAVTRARVTDACGRTAGDVVERDARLALVSATGALLGDCDGDGAIGDGESLVTTSALRAPLRDAAYDLTMLHRDGSRGVHNPAYTFEMIQALDRALPATW